MASTRSGVEVERLERVYREYMPRVASRWDSSNTGNRAILAQLERGIADELARAGLLPLAERSVLDVGCGYGHFLWLLESLGAQTSRLHGIDLLAERIAHAASAHPQISFTVGNAEELPYPDRSFDLVMLLSVLTSVLDVRMREAIVAEVSRVLRPGGAVLWYDFRFDDPWNPNVRGIGRRELGRCFPGWTHSVRTITLLPPLARRLGPLTPALYPTLAAVPLLRTHYLGLLEPPAA
jgi:ubiquinone/menaquinone biosynthesis C-methylase UbiE